MKPITNIQCCRNDTKQAIVGRYNLLITHWQEFHSIFDIHGHIQVAEIGIDAYAVVPAGKQNIGKYLMVAGGIIKIPQILCPGKLDFLLS